MSPHGELLVDVNGRTSRLSSGVLTIGRDGSCDVSLTDDRRISRQHVRIELTGGGWIATSTGQWGMYHNGVKVDRIAINSPVTLRLADAADGPVVRIAFAAPHVPPAPFIPPVSPLTHTVERYASFVGDRRVVGVFGVGRAPDNDIVLSDDYLVSRHHAQLVQGPSGFELVDLSSSNGTFVNGSRVQRALLSEGDVITIGRRVLTFAAGRLREFADDNATLIVRDVKVQVDKGRKVLLDGVSFAVEPGQLVAVVGTSGAGKSTLIKVLTGSLPVSEGSVTYNGRPLHDAIEELGPRLGYVPQDDILHTQLPLADALRFAADLRFAPDVSAVDRDARVQKVMEQLGIAARADLAIDRLSGGQRKRASIALELLTEPSLLFLDEPTSGLDPGFERSVMELLRELANSGRTIIVITHAVASLELCDRLLFMSPGGHPAYYGPPQEALGYFQGRDWSDVFRRLEVEPTNWSARFAAHPLYEKHVAEPLKTHTATSPNAARAAVSRFRQPKKQQFATLVRRQLAVLRHSRSQLYLLAAQAPVIALLLVAALGGDNLVGPQSAKARTLLTVLILAATTMGLVNSSREIVRELPIYRRERAVGLDTTVYLASKGVFLGAIGTIQIALLMILVVRPQGASADGVIASVFSEIGLMLFLTLVVSIAMGLAVSALVDTDATALVMIPVLIIAQLVLANGLLVVDNKPVLAQASWVSPSSWGFAGSASSANLKRVEGRCPSYLRAVVPGDENLSCSGLFDHKAINLLIAVFMLLVLAAGYLALAYWGLRRRDPVNPARAGPQTGTRTAFGPPPVGPS